MSEHDGSDSGATHSSDDKPRTPPPIPAPRRAKTAHSFTVPSRIPKRASKAQSLSQPQTPDPPVRPAEPLDWGSSGEWRRMSEKVNRDSSEIIHESERALLSGTGSFGEPFDPGSPLQEKSQTGQLAHSASLSDDEHANSDLELWALSGEDSADDELSAILARSTGSLQKPNCLIAGVARTTIGLSSNDPDTSDSDSKLLESPFEGAPPASGSWSFQPFPSISPKKDESVTSDVKETHDTREVNENEEWSAIMAQTCGNVTLTKIDRLLARLGHNTRGLDNGDHDASESDQSVVIHSVAVPHNPLMDDAEDLYTANKAAGISPQVILRGLIRDAHREMMYFTLSHAQFDKADLIDGLDYAFTMLQNATTKLAILATLHDDMADFSAEELNIWLVHVDRLDPQTCYEPRMPVVFESLSLGEIQIALAELVQSRLIAEGEVKQMKTLLKQRAEASAGRSSQGPDEDNLLLDGVFTAFMVIVIGALYFCVT